MTNKNPKRQPAGSPKGGEFAPDRKPDGGDLTIATMGGSVIAQVRHLDISDKAVELNAGNTCLFCGRGSGFVNRSTADRMSDDGSINVTGYMCAECDGCEDDADIKWCPTCDSFTDGEDEVCYSCESENGSRDIDAPVPDDAKSLCTECTGETNFDFDAFAFELQAEVDATKIGTELSSGTKIAEWVSPGSYDNDVLVQVLDLESDDADDAAGWNARGVAQILKEQQIKTAKMSDVLEIFNDGDVKTIAFDPRRGTHQVLMEINEALKEMS